MTKHRAIAFLLGLLAAPAVAPTAAFAAVIYDKHGLVVETTVNSRSDWNTGQRQTTRRTTITFNGKSLCGPDIGKLLYPAGQDNVAARAFFCASTSRPLETDAVLAYFTSSSAREVLAHLQVVNGALRATRIVLSDNPDRNRPGGTRFEDARLPGWTRVNTAWNETVLIRHAPLKAQNLGPGQLLDIDNDVVYLAVPPGRDAVEVEPAKRVKDAHGYLQFVPAITKFVDRPLAFRAVRLSDGRELARLDVKDTCTTLPVLQFDRPDATSTLSSKVDIPFDDVPAWRARTLQLSQGQGRATLRLQPGVVLPTKPNCKPG